jgi:hypothetical protein
MNLYNKDNDTIGRTLNWIETQRLKIMKFTLTILDVRWEVIYASMTRYSWNTARVGVKHQSINIYMLLD